MEEWERILLEGRLLDETRKYGESQWGWLGKIAYSILPLVPLSQKMIKLYPTRISELIFHLMLFWRHGFYKSTMTKTFCNDILRNWSTHTLGEATVPAIRGSVLRDKKGRNKTRATFSPPAPILADIIHNSEFHTLLNNKGAQSLLQTWLGDQTITNANAYIDKLTPHQRHEIETKYPGLVFNANGYTVNITSCFLSCCNTNSLDIKRFDNSVYDRMGVLHFPDTELDEELANEVNILSRNPPPEELMLAWDWMANIQTEDILPEIPIEWKKQVSGLPRMHTRSNSMTYSFSLAFLPQHYGYLCTKDEPYPEMVLSEKALELSQLYIEDFKVGQQQISNSYSRLTRGVRQRKSKLYEEYIEKELGTNSLTTQEFSEYFHVTVEAARLQFLKRGLDSRKKKWIREE